MDSTLNASVLGQMLLMQSVLTSLPDEKSIFDFVCRGLRDIPGVKKVILTSDTPDFSVVPQNCFHLEAAASKNGFLCFEIAENGKFAPYVPYIKNFCVIISVIIEEKKQRIIKESYNRELQKQVAFRTSQLEDEITKHKETAKALKENAEKFSAIFNQSSEGIFLHDFEGRILDVNNMSCIQSGYTRDELLNMYIFDLHPKKEGSSNFKKEEILELWKTWSINNIFKIETEHVRKDGTIFPINLSSGVIRIGDEHSILDIVQDITASKLAASEKEKLQQQLFHSQKMEAIGVLAGGVAHDFNNILGIILGCAKLAEYEVPKESEAARELSLIIDSAIRARELTSKLLTFARKEKAEKTVNSIKEIMENISSVLMRALPKNIIIRTAVKEDITLLCDQNQLHQAIMNLSTNAADAMPSGGILTIECNQTRFHEGVCDTCGKEMVGDYCLIQVSDNGIGIDKEMIPKITDPFFTTKGVGKGTGLGLSVTLGIVVNHDGHMHIYSEMNKGTCIKMYLPVGNIEKIDATDIKKTKDTSGDETILIIDDEKPLLEVAGRFLKRKGYNPILALGGKQGIELYKEFNDKISVVLLDLMMPEIDGADVFRELKNINSNVRVIFASGYSINGSAEELIRKEAHQFVQKPYDMEELCATVRTVIDIR